MYFGRRCGDVFPIGDQSQNPQASATDRFEWSSESDEALDRTLSFVLNSYAVMDAIELQFPTGDTYKFNLEIYDGDGDPSHTLIVSKMYHLVVVVVS